MTGLDEVRIELGPSSVPLREKIQMAAAIPAAVFAGYLISRLDWWSAVGGLLFALVARDAATLHALLGRKAVFVGPELVEVETDVWGLKSWKKLGLAELTRVEVVGSSVVLASRGRPETVRFLARDAHAATRIAELIRSRASAAPPLPPHGPTALERLGRYLRWNR